MCFHSDNSTLTGICINIQQVNIPGRDENPAICSLTEFILQRLRFTALHKHIMSGKVSQGLSYKYQYLRENV